MKKTTLLIAFILSVNVLFSQNQEQTAFKIKVTNPAFEMSKLQTINSQMFDLYRSKSVDNDVTVVLGDQTIIITLLSADKMKELGLPFNEEFVKKGAVMSGVKANISRNFTWKIEENNSVTDLTNY